MYRLRFLVLVAGISAKKKKKQKSFQNNFKFFTVSSVRQYFNKGFILKFIRKFWSHSGHDTFFYVT